MKILFFVLYFVTGFCLKTSLSAPVTPPAINKNYQIVFKLDLSEELKSIDLPSSVDICGSIKSLSWEKFYPMADQDRNGVDEATVAFNSTNPNLRIDYQYVINDTRWETSAAQRVAITTSSIKLPIDTFNVNNKSEPRFSPQEIRNDLKYLYTTLQQSHYDLYVHTKKEVFDKKYSAIYKSITDSLTAIQTIRLFKPLLALAKHAHCDIWFPWHLYSQYGDKGGTVFPLDVSISDRRAYVTNVYTDNPQVAVGDEIISINKIGINKHLDKMYSFVSGDSEYMINTLIDGMSFPRLLWLMYDKIDRFELEVLTREGKRKNVIVNSMPAKLLEERRNQTSVPSPSREFKFIEYAAYLRPGIFLNLKGSNNTSEQITFDKGEFVSFIDSAFVEIKEAKSKSLIIDLRGNPGGDNSFSDHLVAYFATKPFWFYSEFNVKTSQITKKFWKDVDGEDPFIVELKDKILTYKDGKTFKMPAGSYPPRTDSLRFTGKVFVLIDRYSYSNTVSVAAIMKDYGFAQLVGEPTSDVATGYGSVHQFTLPNTGVGVVYPKALIVRPNGNREPKGVSPDVHVSDDRFTEKDEIMLKVMELAK